MATCNLPLIIKRRQGNVGIGTFAPLRSFHVEGDMRITGTIYDAFDQPFQAGGGGAANLEWRDVPLYPLVVSPSNSVFQELFHEAQYRYSGNEIVYRLDYESQIVQAPTDKTLNYTMSLPVAYNSNVYNSSNIIGDFWLKVSSNELVTNYKALARAVPGVSNVLILRYLTGTTERSWADFNSGFKTNLSGTLFYQTEEYFKPTPVSNPILDASITQDNVGHIVINGGGFAPRARLDVVQTSNLPVLIADQQRTDGGDLFQAKYKSADKFAVKQNGDLMVAGVVYDSNYQAVWLPGNVVEWKTAVAPIYVPPLGMSLPLTSNTAKYRFVGHEVAYQFSTVVTLTGTPSDPVAYPDISITLAPYFATSAYPVDTIVGDVWISASYGGNTTMYKGFARTVTGSAGQSVTLRYLNSIYDRPFADFVSGTVLDIRGSLLYQSSSTSYLTVPQTYTPARMKQDVDGRIIVSQIEEAPQGRFHIKESSTEPAMIVEQMGTGSGDAFQFRSNAVPTFVVNRSGNIGVGTTQATFPIDINGNMRITGSVYNQANEAIWIDGTTVSWKAAAAPAYVLPAGVTFQYATSNATFRYIGNEIIYNFMVSGTVKSAPTVAGADYKIALQYPVLQSAYPADAIVGDLWFNVTSNVSSTTYKAYARTMSQPSSNYQMTTRFLNGAMDMPLSAIAVNSATTLQGTIVYQTPNPAFGFPIPFKTFKGVIQDQDENIVVNGGGEATLGRFTVVQTSNQPALIVNNKTPIINGNDTVQFKQNNNVVMRLTSQGHLLPGACNTYDLGSSDYRFKDLYLSGNTLDIGGTQIKRMEATGALMITDDTGDAQSGYFKHVYVDGTIQGSNLKILGDFVTLDTITSNTEQMVITNAGTGPALKVTQTGANSIAEFYDDGNVLALKIADGGNVGIGTGLPLAKLHVVGGIKGVDGTEISFTSSTCPADSFNYVMNGGNDTGTKLVAFVNGSTRVGDNGPSATTIRNDGGALFLGKSPFPTIFPGNIGIGTTNPSAKLHILNGDQSITRYGPNTTWSTNLCVGSGSTQLNATTGQCIVTDGNLHLDTSTTASKALYLNFYANGGGTTTTNPILSYGNWVHRGYMNLTLQPAFCVWKDDGLVSSAGAIVWNRVEVNISNSYSSSTGRFTAPIAGRYLFSISGMTHNAVNGWLQMMKNDATRLNGFNPYAATVTYSHTSGTTIAQLALNDYVDVRSATSSMYSVGNGHNQFCGFLIG